MVDPPCSWEFEHLWIELAQYRLVIKIVETAGSPREVSTDFSVGRDRGLPSFLCPVARHGTCSYARNESRRAGITRAGAPASSSEEDL
jgi:hypothetical protein